MPQLRDATTSEHVFTGTPLEVAAVAQELGAEVIFDDVGEGFDPAAVLKGHHENVKGLEGAAKEAKGDQATQLTKAAKEARAKHDGARGEADRVLSRVRAARNR